MNIFESNTNIALLKLPFVLYYQGNYKDSPVVNLITIVENNLSAFYKKGVVRKLTYLAVEALQNIERYSQHDDNYDSDFALIYSDGVKFHIITQNLIRNTDIDNLKRRIDEVNSKHKEELNEIFISQLESEEGTTKGAGLGLIDMARKTTSPLKYLFTPVSDELSYYRLHIAFDLVEEQTTETQDPEALILALNKRLDQAKSSLCYIGDFSNHFLQELLKMLKEAKGKDIISANTKFHHILIEFTQNVKRHAKKIGDQIPACLSIDWANNQVFISVQNLVDKHDLSKIHEKINLLNLKSDEDLAELSKEILHDFDNPGGLGLVDVAVLSRPNKIDFNSFDLKETGTGIEVKTTLNY
jgi:hypothetical protein